MCKQFLVTVTDDERQTLHDLINKGTISARRLTRAHMLLRADEGAADRDNAESLHVARTTVERLRQRLVEDGLDAAL